MPFSPQQRDSFHIASQCRRGTALKCQGIEGQAELKTLNKKQPQVSILIDPSGELIHLFVQS
jgi:hypothetical protein